jgi:NCAIR mutase (PurE)-related protein
MGTVQRANVLIVVAGMEGALPSVAQAARQTSDRRPHQCGYRASFGGLAALLDVDDCGSGVTVVNDNSFGRHAASPSMP